MGLQDNNIDLTLIKGSGPDGRIIKKDIQNFELHINDENISVIEPSSIRKIIAERTTQTKNEVPHFYLTIETRMDKLINLRKKINSNEKDDSYYLKKKSLHYLEIYFLITKNI